MRAIELRSVNFRLARVCFRNSNSAGCRGQNPSASVTVRSSLFFTERIWPSWLVQNCSGFIRARAGDGRLGRPTQAGRSGLHFAKVNGSGGNFYGTNPASPLLYPRPNPRMKLKHLATIFLSALGLAVA